MFLFFILRVLCAFVVQAYPIGCRILCPPIRCKCKWNTVCPPSTPVFVMRR